MDRPSPRPVVLFALAFVAALAVMSGWSSHSRAAVICVPNVDEACALGSISVQGALDQAALNSGHDEVRISPGLYSGDLTYDAPADGNTVDVVGTGEDPSYVTLLMVDMSGNNEGFGFISTPGSTLRNLTYNIAENTPDAGSDHGLYLDNVSADEIVVKGNAATDATAIRCRNCSVTDSLIDLPLGDGISGSTSTRDR